MASPLRSFPISGAYSTHTYNRTVHRRELRVAMDGKTTLMSPEDFLQEFVRKPAQEACPSSLNSALSSLAHQTKETLMYDPMMDALNAAANLCPGYTFVPTPYKGDKASDRVQAVDCGLYPTAHVPPLELDPATGKPSSRAVDWSRISVPIEVKSTSNKDPFDDSKPDGQPSALSKKDALGQILAYAQSVFEHQHLAFLFMVFIIDEDARIARIDRSGVFVTTKFNYKTSAAPLIEFFWRFARLSSKDQGQDPTAERVPHDSEDAQKMRAKLETAPDDYVRKLYETSLDEKYPWWILKFKDERTKESKRFFVGKPHFVASGLAGRGTRGYVALDADDCQKPLVYLKDSWRVVHEEIQKEGAVLETLNANNVAYVPTVLYHGDLDQHTTSEALWRKYHPNLKADAPYPLKPHSHYRLVVKEVGKPLKEFENASQLVSALCCCLLAHAQAYYKLSLIHRDISAGNILLYPQADGTWGGMLNDWELAKNTKGKSPKARQPDRTGTWQFLSADALNHPKKEIVVQDELESVIHVLIFMAIRFLPHNCAKEDVGRLLYNYFDDCHATPAGYECGPLKMNTMETGKLAFRQKGHNIPLLFYWSAESAAPHPIQELLDKVLAWFAAYYATIRKADEESSKKPLTRNRAFRPVQAVHSMASRVNLAELFAEAQSAAKPSDPASPPTPQPRDPEADEKEAANLQNHLEMVKLFQEFLEKKDWPEDDKTDDKRPERGYNPRDDMERISTADGPTEEDLKAAVAAQVSKRLADAIEDPERPSTPKHRRTADTDSE